MIFIIFQSLNAYSESKIFHEKNQDGTRNFDIEFIFQSKNNVRQNFDLLTDFLKIHRFNPSVYETEIISRESKEKTVLKTTFRNCVHFFCREMIMYESILTYCIDDQILSCVIKAEVMPNDESPVFSGNTSGVPTPTPIPITTYLHSPTYAWVSVSTRTNMHLRATTMHSRAPAHAHGH